MTEQSAPRSRDSHQTVATVTACTYEFGAGRALAFGLPTSRHFRIAFRYFAHGVEHTGSYSSAEPLPVGTRFLIAYNPEAPQQNYRSRDRTSGLLSLVTVGVLGSVILSIVWLAILRGCH